MEYFHVRRPNASPGVGVNILVLRHIMVQPPGAGHHLLLRDWERGRGVPAWVKVRQQRALVNGRGDSETDCSVESGLHQARMTQKPQHAV